MRYIGNKNRLLEKIDEFLKDNIKEECKTFCDIFAGTGSVGRYFKKTYDIISNDYMYYSYSINRGLLNYNDNNHTFEGLKKQGIENIFNYFTNLDDIVLDSIKESFFRDNYSPYKDCNRMYLSIHNAKKTDYIRYTIEDWKNNNIITENEYFYLLMCLIESVSKVSNTTGVYGAYLKEFDSRAVKNMEFLEIETIKSDKTHIVYNSDIDDFIKNVSGDILYMDPPYTNAQYCDQYHLLETLSKYDKPEIFGITGKRDTKNVKSNFAYKGKVRISFENVIKNANFKHIIISYSSDGLLPKDEMIDILKENSIKFNYKEIKYREFKNARTKKDKDLHEYLFYIQKY